MDVRGHLRGLVSLTPGRKTLVHNEDELGGPQS
jgi:hypothetical protein